MGYWPAGWVFVMYGARLLGGIRRLWSRDEQDYTNVPVTTTNAVKNSATIRVRTNPILTSQITLRRTNILHLNSNARIETVITFAQSVYLMFASVYICKETVEHFLLSAGEGHHHHYGDEETDVLGCVLIGPPSHFLFTDLLSASTFPYL